MPVSSSDVYTTRALAAEEQEVDFETAIHASLIAYMRMKGYDSTYIMIANMQFNLNKRLEEAETAEERESLIRKHEDFVNGTALGGNQTQFAETDRIRKEHTLFVIAEEKRKAKEASESLTSDTPSLAENIARDGNGAWASFSDEQKARLMDGARNNIYSSYVCRLVGELSLSELLDSVDNIQELNIPPVQ